jgi:hypothetical protein
MRVGLGARLLGGDSLVWVDASGDIVWVVRLGDAVRFVVVRWRSEGAADGCFVSGCNQD